MAQSNIQDSDLNSNIKININNNNDDSSQSLNKCEENFLSKLKQKVWLAPVIGGILVPVLCITSYLIAIYHKNVYPIWPYVSDAGAQSPAACYFSQIIDLIAILGIIFTVARYKQIKYYLTEVIPKHSNNKEVINDDICKRLYSKNFNALIFGLIVSMGSIGVGNFRTTENLVLHFFSAIPLFIASVCYMSNQVYIGRYLYKCGKIEDSVTSMAIIYYLSFIGSLCCIILSFISGFLLVNKYGTEYEYKMILYWKPDMPGYLLHCIATAFEWMVLFLFFPFQSLCMGRRMKQFQHWDQISF